MKPIEIMPVYYVHKPNLGDGQKKYYGGKSATQRVTKLYGDEDCVLGYYKDKADLISTIIIKGERRYFTLLHCSIWRNHIIKIREERMIPLIEKYGIITDQKGWNKMVKKKVAEGI